MSKVLIIEPHGDDALCSCSSALRSDNEIDILTLAGRDSKGLKDFYPSVRNTEFLDLEELSYYDRPRVSTSAIHKKYLEDENVYLEYYSMVRTTFDNKYLRLRDQVSDILRDKLLKGSYDIILIPVGLNHPYHILVSDSICSIDLSNCPPVLHYVDKPYLQTRYVKEMFDCWKKMMDTVEYTTMLCDKEEEVKEVFKNVYPTELPMLRFSSDILLKSPDAYSYYKYYKGDKLSVVNEFVRSLK